AVVWTSAWNAGVAAGLAGPPTAGGMTGVGARSTGRAASSATASSVFSRTGQRQPLTSSAAENRSSRRGGMSRILGGERFRPRAPANKRGAREVVRVQTGDDGQRLSVVSADGLGF